LIKQYRVCTSLAASDPPIDEDSLQLPVADRQPYPVARTPPPYREREVKLCQIEAGDVSILSRLVVRRAEPPADFPSHTPDRHLAGRGSWFADHQLSIERLLFGRKPLDDEAIEFTAHDDAAGEINGTPA
jgi:hypothetical protein